MTGVQTCALPISLKELLLVCGKLLRKRSLLSFPVAAVVADRVIATPVKRAVAVLREVVVAANR